MAEILLSKVNNFILNGITLKIKDGELFAIVGPSGAGKTTLLNVLAGLVSYGGEICFNSSPIDHLPTCKRDIGYLFQDLLLFPHLTVKKNILFGMARIKEPGEIKNRRVDKYLKLLKINHLSERYPESLSGGEKQRVALARAVISAPTVLLLDEPFASLDFRTARYLRLELKRLQKELKITMIFVTHNLDEAFELGDRIGVLQDGMLVQVGQVEELRLKQDDEDLRFLENPNLLECTHAENLGNGLVSANWAGLRLFVPDDGKTITHISILPRDVFISPLPPPGPPINRFKGTVKEISKGGGMATLMIDVAGNSIKSEITLEYLHGIGISEGDNVYGILKLRSLHGC